MAGRVNAPLRPDSMSSHIVQVAISSSLPAQLFAPPAPRVTDNLILSAGQASVAGSQRTVRRSSRTTRKRVPRNVRPSVLVVDDVNDVTDMIGLFLKHAGYDVVTADRAAEALELARSRKFDLVISDIGMPEMNGYEFVEQLRGMTSYTDVPTIAVTGYTEYDDRGRSLRAGFNAHLTKPIEPTRLLDLINELLS